MKRPLLLFWMSTLAWASADLDSSREGRSQNPESPVLRVCGKVVSVECTYKLRTTSIYIAAEDRKTILPVIIEGRDRIRFKAAPEDAYSQGTDVCASGRIHLFKDLPRLTIGGPEDIEVRSVAARQPWGHEHYYLCDDGIEPPVLASEVKPRYTAAAIDAHKQGVIALEALVGANGRVLGARVTKSLDTSTGLDDAALSAMKQWRFKPGTRYGQPAPVVVVAEMTFTLRP